MTEDRAGRVLLYSTRETQPTVSRCHIVEFEELVRSMDAADLLVQRATKKGPPRVVERALSRLPLGFDVSPKQILVNERVDRDYDLFLAFVQAPGDLLGLEKVDQWQARCPRRVAFVSDLWLHAFEHPQVLQRALGSFDHVFLICSMSVEPLQRLVPGRVHYLPPAVDALAFCPRFDPAAPPRSVDVYYMGRRSPTAHAAFLAWAEADDRMYLHDTHGAGAIYDPLEHRKLLGRLVRRTKFFIVNRGLVNRTRDIASQEEIPSRFFEGAAGGAILVGEAPKNEHMKTLFGWDGVVTELPFHSEDGPALVRELEQDEDRLDGIRRENVRQSLTRHDWMYRYATILETVGLPWSDGMHERKRKLVQRAEDL